MRTRSNNVLTMQRETRAPSSPLTDVGRGFAGESSPARQPSPTARDVSPSRPPTAPAAVTPEAPPLAVPEAEGAPPAPASPGGKSGLSPRTQTLLACLREETARNTELLRLQQESAAATLQHRHDAELYGLREELRELHDVLKRRPASHTPSGQPSPTRVRASLSPLRHRASLSPLLSDLSGLAREGRDDDLVFVPDTESGIPNVAAGVDVDALIEKRATYKARKEGDPFEKLDGTDRGAYFPWRRAVCSKIAANLPAFLYHRDQIEFAMSHITGSLLQTMSRWLAASPPPVLFPAFMAELERILGIAYLQREARHALHSLRQEPGDTVSVYYTKALPTLQQAGIPVDDQIDRFFNGLSPRLRAAMLTIQCATLKEAREHARSAEWRLSMDQPSAFGVAPRRSRYASVRRPPR
ncbi:hypothetical protein KEM52_002522 [Ascosphaera acerosa]|nr:hypothetical protein KEM52_002522 [Ascosphaera acerosa]